MRWFSQNGGGTGGGGGGDGPFDTHWVWVSTSGGDDATGDGTVNKPFATIGAANASISDNSSANQYQVLIAPGTYAEASLTLKSWVAYVGLAQITTAVNVDSVVYDPDYDDSGNAPTSCQNLIFPKDPGISGDATIHNPIFVDCIFQAGLTLTGAASFSPWNCIVAATGATVTDVYSVFSRTCSFEGGVATFASATLASECDWDADQDRYIFGVTVTQSSGQSISFSVDGDVEGPVTLDTALASFEGTMTACGTSLVLTGGAVASQYTLDGAGNAAAGNIPIADGAGHFSWGDTFPNDTDITFATTSETPATSGRINFCGDAGQTFLSWRFSGTDYGVVSTDGSGTLYFGFGGHISPNVIVYAGNQVEIANSAFGSHITVADALYLSPAGVPALKLVSTGTGSGLGVQSGNVPIVDGVNTLTLGQGILPGVQLSGALTGAASVVFGDAPGLYFVDTSQVTGVSEVNTLTFANASGATATPITHNIGFYIVWVDSQGPNTILAGGLAPPT